MKSLGAKEKKDLFFQYLVMFTLAAGALLAALFLTRDANPNTAGMDEQTQQLFHEFDRFDKSKPGMEKLIDTVTAEADKIATQNEDGSLYPVQTANGLINDFGKNQDDINLTNNAFAGNIVKLLKLYINSKNEIKATKDQDIDLKQQYKDCLDELRQKKRDDLINNLIQQNQKAQPAEQ